MKSMIYFEKNKERQSMINIIIFSIVALAVFIYTVVNLIKKNNSNYLFALIPEFVGLIIDFFCIFLKIEPNLILLIIMYSFSLVIPIILLILEKKEINLSEIINITKANLYEKKEQYDLAKKQLIININKYPNNYYSHQKLAEWYEKNGELEKAESEYIKTIELKPKKYENYYKLALIFDKDEKRDEAIEILKEVLKRKTDYLEASLCLGNILYETEMYKEAINVFQEALKYSPGEYKLYYYMGMTYTRINDFPNAKEYYKKAATINSTLDVAKLNLGQIYLIFKEYDNAETYFMKCIEDDDEEIQAEAYFYLSKIKLINNENNLAIQYANISLELNPELIKRMEKDIYFVPILGKIKTKEDKNIKTKLNKEEKSLINYLDKTYGVVQNLTSNEQTKEKSDIQKERE